MDMSSMEWSSNSTEVFESRKSESSDVIRGRYSRADLRGRFYRNVIEVVAMKSIFS